MASKYSEAVRELLEAELECPHCHAYNTVGRAGRHIHIDEYGLAVCDVCLRDFRPELPK
jgi:transcription elongation factor Elf1